MQISSELRSAVQESNIGKVGSNPMWKAAGLTYDVHMSDCEDRWVALYHKPEDHDYTYDFVYIDPQAGFTLHFFGRFTIDVDGNYHAAANPLPPDKYSLKIRLDQNGIAALLPPRGLAQLGLPEKPDWLSFYEDKPDSVTHKVNWGSFYNGIGDSRRAIIYLESAYKERPDAPMHLSSCSSLFMPSTHLNDRKMLFASPRASLLRIPRTSCYAGKWLLLTFI
jgi:hypothetical protein